MVINVQNDNAIVENERSAVDWAMRMGKINEAAQLLTNRY